jgi:H+/gluconate symporter-like permease
MKSISRAFTSLLLILSYQGFVGAGSEQENKMDPKSFLKSKTIIGAIVMILAFFLSQFGFDVTTSEITGIVTKAIDAINTIIFIAGAILTIYGRFRAQQQLRVPGKADSFSN